MLFAVFAYFPATKKLFLFTLSLAGPSQGQPDAAFTPENMEKLLQMRKAINKGTISKIFLN
jgi:hypothetical protein